MEPSKEERIQSVLPKPDGSLARIMPSSATELIGAANSAIHEIFTNGTINEDSPIPCDKMTLKTVCETYIY